MRIIAGPCAIEYPGGWALDIAGRIREVLHSFDIEDIYFKGSYDKANRTSLGSFRGIDFTTAMVELQKVKRELNIKTITDVHESCDVQRVARYVSALQVPAFLCRQTDLIAECVRSGLAINIKKGQFLSPDEGVRVHEKAVELARDVETGEPLDNTRGRIWMCERGTSFGYNRLVVDIPGLVSMAWRVPTIFDCTHSVQLPGGRGAASGGMAAFIPFLARAVAATGAVEGYFMEVHPDPKRAKSDNETQIPLDQFPIFIEGLLEAHELGKRHPLGI